MIAINAPTTRLTANTHPITGIHDVDTAADIDDTAPVNALIAASVSPAPLNIATKLVVTTAKVFIVGPCEYFGGV